MHHRHRSIDSRDCVTNVATNKEVTFSGMGCAAHNDTFEMSQQVTYSLYRYSTFPGPPYEIIDFAVGWGDPIDYALPCDPSCSCYASLTLFYSSGAGANRSEETWTWRTNDALPGNLGQTSWSLDYVGYDLTEFGIGGTPCGEGTPPDPVTVADV